MFPAIKRLSRSSDICCPNCACRLTPFRCDRVIIDMCERCHGIWFDRRKIGVFRNALKRFDYSKLKIELPSDQLPRIELYACPRCPEEPLIEGVFAYNSNVHVHVCQRCRGLWTPLRYVIELIADAQTSQHLAPHLRGYLKGLRDTDPRYRSGPIRWYDWLRLP